MAYAPTGKGGTDAVNFADGPQNDSFGRLRVSLPKLRLSAIFDTDKRPLFWDESTTATGAATHDANKGAVEMTLAAPGDAVLRRTKQYFVYRAAQGQQIFCSFVMAAPATDVSVVLRSFTSGAAADRTIAQADWNLDTFDGSGPSGISLDFTKVQILVIDFQSLFSGRARIGFDVDGVITYAHQFLNANILAGPFWRRAKLPVEYSVSESGGTLTQTVGYTDDEDGIFLKATGAWSGSASMLQICSSVLREGGDDEPSVEQEARSNADVTPGAAWTTVLGLRLQAGSIRATLRVLTAGLFNIGSNYVEYAVVLNPVYLGSPTWAAVDGGAEGIAEVSEFAAAINLLVSGAPAAHVYPVGGYVAGGGTGNRNTGAVAKGSIGDTVPVVADIAGVPDEVWLIARAPDGASDVRGLLSWVEER